MSYLFLVTRHLPQRMNKFQYPSDIPGEPGKTYTPFGLELEPPFPTAKVQFIEFRDGFFFVNWIDARLARDAESRAASMEETE